MLGGVVRGARMGPSEAEVTNTGLMDLPPTPAQTWSAAAVTAIALVALGAVAPFANTPLWQLNILFPLLDSIVFVADSITAALLYSQFAISRSRAVFALATGYLFTALIVIPHALTISGAFSPTGLLGANIQTGSWLFIFWHFGFAVSLLTYALLRAKKPAAPNTTASPLPAIFWSLVGLIGLVCGLTWLATAGATLLPQIVLDSTRISPIVIYPISLTILVTAAAFVVLWMGKRALLDQWLMVVAVVYIAELTFSGILPSVRFSVGFYAGRAFSIVTSSIVLIILLAETTQLYVRAARTNAILQRERSSKLMGFEAMAASIAHEVKQPLTAIANNGEATLLFLDRITPSNLGDVKSSVKAMIEDSHRAAETLDSIRALFGRTAVAKEQIDLNDLTLEVLRIFEPGFKGRSIETRSALAFNLPVVTGHKGQLREVITNLIQNAMEAMDLVDGRRVLTVRTERDADDAAAIVIQDNGPGISEEKVFDPFVTTKPHSMGLGLAICRLIVERHSGILSVSPADPRGAIFRIILPRGNLS